MPSVGFSVGNGTLQIVKSSEEMEAGMKILSSGQRSLMEQGIEDVKQDEGDENLLYKDIIDPSRQGLASDLQESYNFAKNFLQALTIRLNYFKQYEKWKNKAILNMQVQRLATIRKDTSYQIAIDSFLKAFGGYGHQ